MSIGEVQFRIAHIQSMMTTATGAARAPNPTAATTAAGALSASRFAAALEQASGTAPASAVEPHAPHAPHETHAPAKADPAENTGAVSGWTAPAHGRISSEFGPRWGTRHQGIDIAAGKGSTVIAAAAGVVRKASWYGGYGNAVVIDHGKGVSTLYGHNSELTVKPGDRVQAGEKIAEVGSTGDSTGPHLHFEVQLNGKKIDPRPWLERRGIDL